MFKFVLVVIASLAGAEPAPIAGFDTGKSFDTNEACMEFAKGQKDLALVVGAKAQEQLGDKGRVVGVQGGCIEDKPKGDSI